MPDPLYLTSEMVYVLGLLMFTLLLFITEWVRVDVAAMLIMVSVGLFGLVPADKLFDGFASNAVIAIIAIMIIGAGLDNTGIMTRVAQFIVKIGGKTEKRILPVVLGTAAIISSFMPNVGAAALMLPVTTRISAKTQVPLSRLLMPMGFCAILGGTLSLIGCSSLIVLNDLLLAANKTLPPGIEPMVPFHLFATTPVGLALVTVGISYFMILGSRVLPALTTQATVSTMPVEYFQQRYGIKGDVFELLVAPNSPLVGASILDYEQHLDEKAAIIALLKGKNLRISPARDVILEAGDSFAILGEQKALEAFAKKFHLMLKHQIGIFTEMLASSRSGVYEVVIPEDSQVIGQSLLSMRMRKTYGLSVLQVARHHQVLRDGLRDLVLQEGDTLLVHSTWEDLLALKNNKNFVTLAQYQHPEDPLSPKARYALGFALLSLSLVLLTELRLGLALFIGAVGMVLSGVISVDEAYKRISWQTVFLLAGLIPLGKAFQETGTAAWIAQHTVHLLGDMPLWVLQTALVLLATLFTQLMSNVGTTVLLVPLAINIAVQTGGNPAVFALTVALGTSNTFLLPTHQVNALVMGPGGYRVADYLRAGGIMTILFPMVLIPMMNWVW